MMKISTLKAAKLAVKIMLLGVLIIVLAGVAWVGYGFLYNKDEAKLKITDFSESKTVTLKPYKFYPYAMINIKVKGYTNDTIKIKENYYGGYDILLIGKIDTIQKMEYYGEGPVEFTFDPYKATQGKLEIEIDL